MHYYPAQRLDHSPGPSVRPFEYSSIPALTTRCFGRTELFDRTDVIIWPALQPRGSVSRRTRPSDYTARLSRGGSSFGRISDHSMMQPNKSFARPAVPWTPGRVVC